MILEAETFHVCTGLDEKPKRLPEEYLSSDFHHHPSIGGHEIEACVRPELILEALRKSAFTQVKRDSRFGVLSEYTAVK